MSSRISTLYGDGLVKLENKIVCVVGCGAIGTRIAEQLSKFPFRELILIDRDFVDESNLSTSLFFTKEDIRGISKVDAVKREIKKRSEILITSIADDLNPRTLDNLEGSDIIFDATDNLSTRFLINDFCVKNNISFVFSSAIAKRGMSKLFLPGEECFKCLVERYPKELETCETSGVSPMISSIICGLGVNKVINYLLGGDVNTRLNYVDLAKNKFLALNVSQDRECMCCQKGNFEHLSQGRDVVALCGEGKYQILPQRSVDLQNVRRKLDDIGKVIFLEGILFFTKGKIEMTIFEGGRAIISNVREEKEARSVYSRFVGD